MRIIICGASGSGTSTLGRALASRLASQHFDADAPVSCLVDAVVTRLDQTARPA